MSLYTDLIEAGQEVDHWQSDLYCRVNAVTTALLAKHGITTARAFISQVDGQRWYDVPFQYDPFWSK